MVARGNWFRPCTRETILSQDPSTPLAPQNPRANPATSRAASCLLLSCAPSLVEESRSPLLLLKPEILLMSFTGSSTAGALDLLSVWGAPTPSAETATQKKNTRKRKAIHCKPVSDDCPFGEGRNPGQGKAGEGRRTVGGEKLETNSKPPKTQGGAQSPSAADGTGLLFTNKV